MTTKQTALLAVVLLALAFVARPKDETAPTPKPEPTTNIVAQAREAGKLESYRHGENCREAADKLAENDPEFRSADDVWNWVIKKNRDHDEKRKRFVEWGKALDEAIKAGGEEWRPALERALRDSAKGFGQVK